MARSSSITVSAYIYIHVHTNAFTVRLGGNTCLSTDIGLFIYRPIYGPYILTLMYRTLMVEPVKYPPATR